MSHTPLNPDQAQAFAASWYAAWNAHDLDAIMSHYDAAIEHSSPFIKRYNGTDDLAIRGIDGVRDYFARALARNPTLRFDPLHVTTGLESVILVYRRMTGDLAAEVFFLKFPEQDRAVGVSLRVTPHSGDEGVQVALVVLWTAAVDRPSGGVAMVAHTRPAQRRELMLRRQSRVAALLAAILVSSAGQPLSASAQAPGGPPAGSTDPANVLTGIIDAVTVYRGQAQVARLIDVPGGSGLREVVVTNLPEAIIPGSLYAESADGVEIRSVSYRIRPIGEDSRDSVRAAEKAVRDAHDALDAARARGAYLEWQRTYLDKLENFVAPAAQAELKSGVLNAETLSKLTDLVTTRRKQQAEDTQKLGLEIRGLTEAVALKERELAVLTTSSSRTAREAVVFVNATKPGAKVRLSYLVGGANWSPSYNLRIPDAKAEKAVLEYQASVQQMSGEDWSGVTLTLSTATPALVATGPSLQPLTVALATPSEKDAALAMLKERGYDDAKKVLTAQLREVERNRTLNYATAFDSQTAQWAANSALAESRAGAGQSPFKSASPVDAPPSQVDLDKGVVLSLDGGLNELADRSQLLDLISNSKVERKPKGEPAAVRQGDEGVSVAYKIPGRTSMPSRADQQLIQIAQMDLPAQVVRTATPTLTQYAYNEAHLTNSGETVLLGGPAASYVGGEFVGSGGLATVTSGEGFRAGFGIDASLRTSKELVERTETISAGNRIIEFTYKLTVENFGKSAASVRLLDRLPSPKGTEIKLSPAETKTALSEDKDYRETDYKKNILRWDISVPPGAIGTSALAVEYKFRLEYDKQMTLAEGK